MIVIELRFLAGRFHATPWGRHVNEGVPEWPPSPYRLVRALYDAWKRKRPDWAAERVERVLAALSSTAPRFSLPRASAAHTRVFLSENTKDPTDRQLVFDPFVVLQPNAAVLVGWPEVTLDPAARTDLDELLSLVNYFGRSESWLTARTQPYTANITWNCTAAEALGRSPRTEPVRVACPIEPRLYRERPSVIPSVPKKGKAKTKTSPAPSAVSWLDALAWSTDDLLDSRRSEPPALRYVAYLRPADCFDVVPEPRGRGLERELHGVLYALESKVLPSVRTTVEVAERFRRKLMGIHKRVVGDPARVSPKFSGKDAAGRPLKGHRHLYLLPLDRNRDGRIDHLIAVSKQPLDRDEQIALDRMASLWQPHGKPDIQFVPLRWGRIEDLFPPVKRFRSATPFVAPRHYRSGRGSFTDWLSKEVAREATNHGLPVPVRVVPLTAFVQCDHRRIRWIEFRRSRKGADARLGFGFQLEFAEPICGPIALGYGCHFGLGLFMPENAASFG